MFDRASLEVAALIAEDINAATGFWPALDDSRLLAHKNAVWEVWEGPDPLDELIDLQRGDYPGPRSVVASTLWFMTFGEVEDQRRQMARDALRRLLDTRPVQSLADTTLLRWELHAAGAAQHLVRVIELARRLDALGSSPDLLARAATTAFLVIHPSIESPLPSVFDPDIHEADWGLTEPWDVLIYSFATIVEGRPRLRWTDPTALTTQTLDALLQMDGWLRRAGLAARLTPTQQAIQLWCTFALAAATRDAERMSSAATGFASLPAHPSPVAASMAEAADKRADAGAWAAASACFARAGRWLSAIEAARTWVVADPQDPQAHRRLAEALYKDGRIPEAIDAFEDYVRHRSEGENDWELSFLLQLGLQVKDARQRASALEMAALDTSFRPQGEALVTWSSPWFPHLCPKARERWWVGLFTLSSRHVVTEIGDARWDQASDCFGEAVGFEFRERVFRPFSASHDKLVPPDKHWQSVLRGTGTLGQMIELLLQTRTGKTPEARTLGLWLARSCPGLARHINNSPEQRLRDFARTRGQAQHGSVDEAQTRQVFTEASKLLQSMASPPLAGTHGRPDSRAPAPLTTA